MIEVEHLSKVYGTHRAINDLSFSVAKGEILGFLGPNGAGKTTTMRILTGYLPASQGTAKVAGHEVHAEPMAVRQLIGYLPESPPLYPDMTVGEFLRFVAALKGIPGGDRIHAADTAMERCGLLDKRRTLIRKLSKGYRQRVGIAQAIVHDPPVIILDEPTVGLDPRQIIEVRELIKSLAGEHTIILSTHILPEVSMTCDRVTIINQGQVVATNQPEALTAELSAGLQYELEVAGNATEIQRALLAIAGVQAVTPINTVDKAELAAGRVALAVQLSTTADLGATLAATLVSQGFGLYRLQRQRASLEDVFLALTTQDPTQPAAPADEELS